MDENFPEGSNQLLNVEFVWGVKEVDSTGFSQWDADNFGEIVWDDTFDISKLSSLEFLIDMCKALDEPRPKFVPKGLTKDVMSCWVRDFEKYVTGSITPTESYLPQSEEPDYTGTKTPQTLE